MLVSHMSVVSCVCEREVMTVVVLVVRLYTCLTNDPLEVGKTKSDHTCHTETHTDTTQRDSRAARENLYSTARVRPYGTALSRLRESLVRAPAPRRRASPVAPNEA